jgi:hypothetical protein
MRALVATASVIVFAPSQRRAKRMNFIDCARGSEVVTESNISTIINTMRKGFMDASPIRRVSPCDARRPFNHTSLRELANIKIIREQHFIMCTSKGSDLRKNGGNSTDENSQR